MDDLLLQDLLTIPHLHPFLFTALIPLTALDRIELFNSLALTLEGENRKAFLDTLFVLTRGGNAPLVGGMTIPPVPEENWLYPYVLTEKTVQEYSPLLTLKEQKELYYTTSFFLSLKEGRADKPLAIPFAIPPIVERLRRRGLLVDDLYIDYQR